MNWMDKKVAISMSPVLATAVAIALASPAFADSTMTQSSPAAQGTTAMENNGAQTQNQRDYRLSHIIGKEVTNKDGIAFGRIQDVVIDMTSGNVRYAILSLRGEIAPGETRLYAIPTKALTMGTKANDLIMNIKGSAWRVKSSPSSKWPDLRNTGYWSEVDELDGFPAVQPTDEGYFAYRGSDLIGKMVQDVEGKRLGVLRDMVIDMNAGKVHYAVLDFEPGLTQADKLFTFPVSSFIFREDKRGNLETARPLELDMEPVALKTMHGFAKNRWPDLNEPGYVAQVEHHLKSMSATSAHKTASAR